jgi:SAM-dependent methyltransferase
VNNAAEFDRFADTYDDNLNQALSVSGENKDYFAHARVQWLKKRLGSSARKILTAMDYGCGIGDTTSLLYEQLRLNRVVGLDVSSRSVQLAQRKHGSVKCTFRTFDQYSPEGDVDLIYCNGVFHHIPLAERAASLRFIHDSLRPEGIFALWENNPWNPGTRYVMSKCVFDRDAITISPSQAVHLVAGQGFNVLRRDFLFFYPRVLKALRFTEPWMTALPLGAQYLLLCQKPGATSHEAV